MISFQKNYDVEIPPTGAPGEMAYGKKQRITSALRDLTNGELDNTRRRAPRPVQFSQVHPAEDIDTGLKSKDETSVIRRLHSPDVADIDDMQLAIAEDIHASLLKTQAFLVASKRFPPEISTSMRNILVDWMIEVAEEYKLVPETLFLSVMYTDVCLQELNIHRSELQLLGTTCIMVAAKYEEIYAPPIDELCYITDNSYTRSQIIKMERAVLKCLEFSLTRTTVNTFLTFYLSRIHTSTRCSSLAAFLAELTLMCQTFLDFTPAVVATAAIFLAEYNLSDARPRILELDLFELLDNNQLTRCIESMNKEFASYDAEKFHALHEKYSSQKYNEVATVVAKGNPLAMLKQKCTIQRGAGRPNEQNIHREV